jgi:hypothetical protein
MQRLTILLLSFLLVLVCGKPDLLIGAWSYKQQAGEVILVLEQDGAFAMTAEMVLVGNGVVRGLWKRKGDQLHLRFEEGQGFLRGYLASSGRDSAIFEIVTLDESRLVCKDTRTGQITSYTRLSPDTAS